MTFNAYFLRLHPIRTHPRGKWSGTFRVANGPINLSNDTSRSRWIHPATLPGILNPDLTVTSLRLRLVGMVDVCDDQWMNAELGCLSSQVAPHLPQAIEIEICSSCNNSSWQFSKQICRSIYRYHLQNHTQNFGGWMIYLPTRRRKRGSLSASLGWSKINRYFFSKPPSSMFFQMIRKKLGPRIRF